MLYILFNLVKAKKIVCNLVLLSNNNYNNHAYNKLILYIKNNKAGIIKIPALYIIIFYF